MADNRVWRVVTWLCRHFLVTWAIVFVAATAIRGAFATQDELTMIIGLFAMGPFTPLLDIIFPWEQPTALVGWLAVALVAGIYVGMDALLWALIRSARRGATVSAMGAHERSDRFRHIIDRTSYWIVRNWFPIWAVIASAAILTIFHLDLRWGATGFHATILYLGTCVSFPLALVVAALEKAGISVQRAETLHTVLISFVIICIAADIAIKRYLRG